jgi:hypothetical protein
MNGPDQGAPNAQASENGDGYKVGPGKPPVASRWKKGQSGNPRGRPRRRTLTELVRGVLEREFRGKVTDEVLAEVIVREGLSGKFPFIKEIWDRLEGKTKEQVEVETRSRSIVLHIDPPRVIGESEEEYRARNAEAAARARARNPGPLLVAGDCWKNV